MHPLAVVALKGDVGNEEILDTRMLRQALLEALAKEGGNKMTGTAPKGRLERKVQEQLQEGH